MSAKTKSAVGLNQEVNKADEELPKVKEELNTLKEEVIKKLHWANVNWYGDSGLEQLQCRKKPCAERDSRGQSSPSNSGGEKEREVEIEEWQTGQSELQGGLSNTEKTQI